MKKLIPYILAYLIVAAATAALFSFFKPLPSPTVQVKPGTVILKSTMPTDQLLARLQQAGIGHETQIETMGPVTRPLLYHFIFFAIYLGSFAGLTHLFRRLFRANVPSRDYAA
jgi:hypothetical protein